MVNAATFSAPERSRKLRARLAAGTTSWLTPRPTKVGARLPTREPRVTMRAMSPRPPRRPPGITDSVLEKSALYYLERYAASSGQLRRVLLRRIKRAQMLGAESTQLEAARGHVEVLISRFVASGILDDRRFAESQAQSLQRRGNSRL